MSLETQAVRETERGGGDQEERRGGATGQFLMQLGQFLTLYWKKTKHVSIRGK